MRARLPTTTEACQVSLNTPACRWHTRAKCFACGDAACPGCSRIRRWYRFRRVRVCNDCDEEDTRSGGLAAKVSR